MALVVLYHLFPTRLHGGFVGVDVFFVISGFLITQHLLTRPPRSAGDLAAFWARRVRRLLPASLTVLAVTLVASRLVAPATQWENTAEQVRAACLYVLNWRLAGDAVDYSAADEAATPVQHFWSLSVEEQFYLGWPLLLALLFAVARRTRSTPLRCVRTGLAVVVAGSLAYSVWLTATDPAGAYFVTPTRIWELGAGGLLTAVLAGRADPRPVRWASSVLVVGGLLAIAWSALSYSSATPFPGWHAVVPVLGTAAVIAAGDRRWPGPLDRLLRARPVQRLGDISYSVYLWHWPLIILLPHVSGGELGRLDKLVVVLATVLLAGLGKRHIEDRFRSGSRQRPLRPFVAAAVGMAVVAGLATVQVTEVASRERADDVRLAAALATGGPCLGAAALDDASACPAEPALLVSPAQATKDRYDQEHRLSAKGNDCWASKPDFAVRTCEFGDPEGDLRVAVVGNSHAAQWMAPLEEIAAQRHWRLTTYLAHNCALAGSAQDFDTAEQTRGCRDWVHDTTARVSDGSYDVVVLSNRMSVLPAGQSASAARATYEAGYEEVLRAWQASGETVVALADTPWPGATIGSVPDCLAEHPDDRGECSGDRDTWVPADPVLDAVRAVDDEAIRSIDLTDHICGPEVCEGVVGGAIVYFDFSHLSTTYAQSLAPYLDRELSGALRSVS